MIYLVWNRNSDVIISQINELEIQLYNLNTELNIQKEQIGFSKI